MLFWFLEVTSISTITYDTHKGQHGRIKKREGIFYRGALYRPKLGRRRLFLQDCMHRLLLIMSNRSKAILMLMGHRTKNVILGGIVSTGNFLYESALSQIHMSPYSALDPLQRTFPRESIYLLSVAFVMLLYTLYIFSILQPKPIYVVCCSPSEQPNNQLILISLVLSSQEDLCYRFPHL